MKKTILFLLISIASFGQASFDEGLELPKSSNTSFIYMKPIRNNLGGFYNQQFFESDQGYSIFRPSLANLPARFYIMPNGTPTGTTSKFEMFNTDYSADWTSYSAFNILMNNTTNTISIGSNRGSGGGTRQKLRIGGDYVGSIFTSNSSVIDFNTDNTLNLNPFNGAVTFGTNNADPYSLSIDNQYTFRNPTTGEATRVNINGNGNSAGALYFGRDGVRVANLGLSGATNVFDISLNKTNTGNALTTYLKVIGSNGNVLLADGGAFTDNAVDRLQIQGPAIATAWKTSGGTVNQFVDGTGALQNKSQFQTALTNPVTGVGVIGRIAFWNTTSNITNDNGLFWDNSSKRFGVGTTLPTGRVDFSGTNGGTFFDESNATYNRWKSYGTTTATGKSLLLSAQNSGTTPDIYIHSSGRVLFSTTTDNGVDVGQFNGSAIATAWKTVGGTSTDYVTGTGSLVNFNSGVRTATLTGYVSGAGVVSASDNVLQAIQKLNGNIELAARPYKVYTALLTQTGTNAPTAVVLENTLGGTVVWSRNSTGDYRATLINAFTLSKTHVIATPSVNPFFTVVGNKTTGSADTVVLLTQTTAGANADDRLQGTPIEIRVYN